MPFKIEEQFEVQAPVERVWGYLITPAKVVVCIPGAELLESQDERTFLGAVKVKVGPMTMSYKGLMKFTEVDEQAHQARMVGEGREAGGAGSAKVTMLSRVTPLASGGSQVVVQAEVDLVGKIVQFGRGMIEEVSKQLFRQFSACVKQQLEVADEPQAPASQSPESQAGDNSPADEPKAVSAVPLVLQALRSVIARFFMRLFGRQTG
jgi:carbon monoxide dehydrogenase subunit G